MFPALETGRPGIVETLIGLLEGASSLEGPPSELGVIHKSESWNASRLRFDMNNGRRCLADPLRSRTSSLSGGISNEDTQANAISGTVDKLSSQAGDQVNAETRALRGKVALG